MRDFKQYPGWALLLLVVGVVVACQTVPITGRSQLQILPESEEMRMGVQSYQDILKKSRLSPDPALNEMVTRVGSRIAAATGRSYPWEYKVIEDKQANAFALPGGKVAVYTGILPITRDEAGLAAVLGHEVSHVIARHGGERVSQQLVVQMGLAGTMAALSSRDPKTVQAVGALLGAGASATIRTRLAISGSGWPRPPGAAAAPRSSSPPIPPRPPASGRSRPGCPRP